MAWLTYLPSLWGAFLYDDQVVLANRSLRDLGDLGAVLRAEAARPLLSLTWALDLALGEAPWHFHLVSVALHAGVAALAARLLRWMADRTPSVSAPGPAALLGACLFAASPMAAETVAYVSSRSTVLATLLGLIALWLAAPALETGDRRRAHLGLAAFVLAALSKEEAAAIPLLLLLMDLFFVAGGRLGALAGRLRRHAPFLAVPLLGLAARRWATGAWLPAPALDPGRYVVTQLAEFPGYLARAAVPIDPAFYRHRPAAPWPPDAATAAWIALTAALVLAAIVWRRRAPLPALAVLWLGAALLPSSSLVALKEMVVDHRAYLGGLGVCLALGAALWRPGRTAFAVVLVGALAARAWQYERVLADPVRAWQDAVRRAPDSAEAWIALGEAHSAAGTGQAEPAFVEATRVDPADARAWTNLGAFYLSEGRLPDAAAAWRSAARAAPGDARVRDNLGMILERLGRADLAAAEYEAALAGSPKLAQPRINLAELALGRGEVERARALLDEAAALDHDPAEGRRIEALRGRLP